MPISFRIVLPSMGNIVFLAVFLPILFSGKRHILLGDVDTGYHIRAGEIILKTLSVPKYDPFSFHSPPLPWTAHEWLAEVIMAVIHQAYGLTGIVVFFAFIIAITYYVLFRILRRDNGNILISAFLVFLVIASSTLHWLARPHVFSLIFVLAYQYVLNSYEYRQKNYLYCLPLLMLVWVNLHGGFVIGFLLVGVYLVGNLARFFFRLSGEHSAIRGRILALGGTLLGCVLASLLNPHGYGILLFPLKLVSDTFLMDSVSEFQSPNFHGTLPFRYLFFLTIVIFAVSRIRADLIETTLVILLTHMALYSARYIPLFAIVVAPILARHTELLLEKTNATLAGYFKGRSTNMAIVDASLPGYLWPIGAVALVFIAVVNSKIHFQFDPKTTPATAVEFLKKETLHGNMLNDDAFGDYVIYAAWPRYKVFIDGRTDMYGASRIREYIKVIGINPDWQSVLDKYNINWAFQPANSPLSLLLLERQDWRLIYADEIAHLFVTNTPENKMLINRFKEVKPISPDPALESSEKR